MSGNNITDSAHYILKEVDIVSDINMPSAEVVRGKFGDFSKTTAFGANTGIAAVSLIGDATKEIELIFINKDYQKLDIYSLTQDLVPSTETVQLVSTNRWVYATPDDTDSPIVKLLRFGCRTNQTTYAAVILQESRVIYVNSELAFDLGAKTAFDIVENL